MFLAAVFDPQDYFRILVRRGAPAPDPWGFLKPFTPNAWLGIMLSALLLVTLLLGVILLFRGTVGKKQTLALWIDYCLSFFRLLLSEGNNSYVTYFRIP